MDLERQVSRESVAIVIFVLISVIFVVVPPLNATPLRIIVGFPLVLFLPGYSLTCALFPKKNEMDGIERIALSIGLSIAVVVIIGLVLNYTPGGIRLGPILLAISSFALISGGIGEVRKKGIKNHRNISVDKTILTIFLLVIIYGFLSHLYFPLRYSGLIADGDMSRITKTIQAMQTQRTMFTSYPYTSGFGLQLIITFLSDITALSIQKLLILPTGFLYLIIAYPLFLKFIKDKKTALLATFLLSLQPDLLFATSRGSHERFTSFLILTSIFILIQLIFAKHDRKKFVIYLTLFYITTFSLTFVNIWFSVFLAFGILFTALIGFFLSKLFNVDNIPSQKMFYITIPLIILFYLTPYIYPPSGSMWRLISIWREKLSPFSLGLLAIAAVAIFSLLLFIKTFSKNIVNFVKTNLVGKFRHKILYEIISFGLFIFLIYILAVFSNLICPPFIWMFLTLFNWIIFPLSVIMALRIIWNFIQKKNPFSLSHLFLLSFYTSFALLLLITIFLDRIIGTGIGDNLELRVFRYFMFFPVALASMEILKWMRRSHTKKWQITGKITFIILIFILSINSLLKSTLDPLVSNKWIFYSGGEKMAMEFIELNSKETVIWAGFDRRIKYAFDYQSNFDSFRKIEFTANPTTAKYYFISAIVRKRARKDEYSLPLLKSLNQVYDNNEARLYERFSK